METWENENSFQLNLNGYNHVSKFRKSKTGGGCCLFISDSIKFEKLENLSIFEESICENLIVKLMIGNQNVIVASSYRPPVANYETALNIYEHIFSKLSKFNYPVYLLGDYNINILDNNLTI